MKQLSKQTAVSVLSLFLVSVLLYGCASMNVRRLSASTLDSMLGKAGVVVIDARRDKEWNESSVKIKGAVREDPNDVSTWAGKYRKAKLIVVYCA